MVANASSVVNKNAKKAGKQANELIKQVAEGQSGIPAPGDDDQAAQKEAEARAEAEAKAKLEASDKAKQDLSQTASPDEGAELSQADKDWEARFKGLQTTYNREVPKLRGELETAYGSIETLQEQIDELKKAITKSEPVEVSTALELTAEEEEQYGPGWVAMMQKIAQGSNSDLAKQVVDLQQELANVKVGQKQIVEHAVVSNEEKFFSTLDAQIPNWGEINNSLKFHEFLKEEVAYTGKTRKFYLDKARSELDSGKIIRIFTDFTDVVPQGSSLNSELAADLDVPEELITPKNLSGGAPPVEEQKYYTNGQINKFFRDKTDGKYKGKEAEARMIEKDIFAAGQEGRIISDKQAERQYQFEDNDKALA